MNLTGVSRPSGFHFIEHPPLSRSWAFVALIVAFGLIFWLDLDTGSAPVQHLYYLPIIFAAVRFGGRGGFLAALSAVVLYHVANHIAWTVHYEESDILRIAMFVAVALIADRQTAYARHLHRLAMTDDLTGLHNLRAFEARLEEMLRDARQRRTPLSLLVLDLDRLKSLNDVHGHLAGAEAVRTVGSVLATQLPADAAACRYGGDEFVVALPRVDEAAALAIADHLRRAVNALAPVLAGIAFPVATLSISVGVACWTAEPGAQTRVDPKEPFDAALAGRTLFHAADVALYAAKRGGRNRIDVTGRQATVADR
jgi:two-component system, NtrC family, C4-dicarboxylate transport sensor histidine kinase DctB